MKKLTWKHWLASCCFAAVAAVFVGCGNPVKEGGENSIYWKDEHFGGGRAVGVAMKPVESKGYGTIEGTVTLNGEIPMQKDLAATMRAHKHHDICLSEMAPAADKKAYSWVIDPSTKAVANVVVFVKPLDEMKTFFNVKPLLDSGKKNLFPKVVKIDQPYCAFEPHVVAVFPRYIDPKDPGTRLQPNYIPSGQELVVFNTASIDHNTRYQGSSQHGASGDVTLPAGTTDKNGKPLRFMDQLYPYYRDALVMKCAIHSWMQGYVWAFPHPFYAVTDAKGKFRIENVPAGTMIRLVGWQESKGFFLAGQANGEEIQVEAGKTMKKDLTITP